MSDKASTVLAAQQATFDDLYRRVHGRLLASLRRMLRNREQAEDVAASAFQTAWQKRDQFRGESSLATWLYAIGRNAALSSWRTEQRRPVNSFESLKAESLAETDGSFDRLEQEELGASVQEALDELPSDAREILVARYVNEHSVREIAQQERLSEGTVGSRLFYARQFLRDAWHVKEAPVKTDPTEGRAQRITEEALKRLTEELQAGRSEALTAYLAAMGRFHRYSWSNALLIQSQRPSATRVAGYHTWRDMGRAVRRGEKGLVIYAPIVGRRTQEQDPLSPERGERMVRGFRTAYVFDVEQTEGKPLPELSRTGGDPREHLDLLKQAVAKRGISLGYDASIAPADGLSYGGGITLRPGLEAAEEFSVLVHELGHELLHRGPDRGELSKTVRETQAEAVAFVVSRGIGLETNTAARDYIALYDGNTKTLTDSLAAIQRAASEILRDILPQEREAAQSHSEERSPNAKSPEQLEFGARRPEPPVPDGAAALER